MKINLVEVPIPAITFEVPKNRSKYAQRNLIEADLTSRPERVMRSAKRVKLVKLKPGK